MHPLIQHHRKNQNHLPFFQQLYLNAHQRLLSLRQTYHHIRVGFYKRLQLYHTPQNSSIFFPFTDPPLTNYLANIFIVVITALRMTIIKFAFFYFLIISCICFICIVVFISNDGYLVDFGIKIRFFFIGHILISVFIFHTRTEFIVFFLRYFFGTCHISVPPSFQGRIITCP